MTDPGIIADYLQTCQVQRPKMKPAPLNYLSAKLQVHHLPDHWLYIREGELQQTIGYIYSGLMRAYYTDNKGNEINVTFLQEGEAAVHFEALLMQKPGKYYFQCIEPVILIEIPISHFTYCSEHFWGFEHYLRLLLQREICKKQLRIDSFIFDNAEMRYLQFVQNHPDLFNRISITQLSSYLGVERQSLTRIRKKLLQKGF